jgi:hypothetical protein
VTSVGPSFSTSCGQLTLKVTVSLLSGSHSITSPEICSAPSGWRTMKAPPIRNSISTALPKKYWRLNSALVSARHTRSGVAAM